jgi:hypothetical protein
MNTQTRDFERFKYRVIANDVSNYINMLVRIAHIICDHDFICRKFVDNHSFIIPLRIQANFTLHLKIANPKVQFSQYD